MRLASKHRRAETSRATAARTAAENATAIGADPELAALQRRYGEAASSALRDAFGALSAQERTVLRLHSVEGLNLDRIGLALGLSRATAGRRMLAARQRLLEETLALLGTRLSLTKAEVESLLGVLQSKLDVSLGALASAPA